MNSLLFFLLCKCLHSSLLYVATVATPPALVIVLQSSRFIGFQEAQEDLERVRNSTAVVDVTFNPVASRVLANICREEQRVHIVVGLSGHSPLEWSYYLEGSDEDFSAALSSLLKYYSFARSNLFLDVTPTSQRFHYLLQSPTVDFDSQVFEPSSDSAKIIGRMVRKRGNRMSVFATSPEMTKTLLLGQRAMHLGGLGYANVLTLLSSLFQLDSGELSADGNIIIADDEFADVSSIDDLYMRELAMAERYVMSASDSHALKQILDKEIPTHSREVTFAVINIVDGKRVRVGRVANGVCEITETVRFLGNSTGVPHNGTATIQLSGNFANINPGTDQYWPMDIYLMGATMAISDINARQDILPDFDLELWNFTGGVDIFDADYFTRAIMPEKHKLGVAIFTNIPSANAMPMIQFLRKNNIMTPVVGSANTRAELSSKADFPNFIRTCLPDSAVNLVIVQMFKRFGWTKCGLLVSGDSLGFEAQQEFHSLFAASNIDIVNDPQYQIMQPNVDNLEDARANFTKSLEHFITTRARVLLLIGFYQSQYVPMLLYDLGLRCGDVIIVAREWMTPAAFALLSEEDRRKSGQIMCGSLQPSPDRFVGTFGGMVKKEYEEKYGISPRDYVCFYYDAALMTGLALDWLITAGRDFSNATQLMRAFANTRFTGCTGLIYFDPVSYSRSPMRYALQTMQINTSDAPRTVGLYDPHGMVLLTIDKDFDWGVGETHLPKDMRNSTIGCPFEDRLIGKYELGEISLYVVLAILFLFASGIAIWVYRTWRHLPIVATQLGELQSVDILVQVDLLVEGMQSLVIGPSLGYITQVLVQTLSVTLVFQQNTNPSGEEFEIRFIVMECTVILWAAAAAIYFPCWKVDQGLTRFLLESITHIFCHWLFIPILSVLLDPFLCSRAKMSIFDPSEIEYSYMDVDCRRLCWQGTHIALISVSLISMFIFIGGTAELRLQWQFSQSRLNIASSVLFLAFKPPLQVFLVAVSKSLRHSHDLLHACLFFGAWTVYTLSALLMQCYGYRKTRILHYCVLSVVLWSAILNLSRLALANSDYDFVFAAITIVGWIVLLLTAAALYSQSPTLLYRRKGMNISPLFNFAFKPANHDILTCLDAEFRRVGHPSRVVTRPGKAYECENEQCFSSDHGAASEAQNVLV